MIHDLRNQAQQWTLAFTGYGMGQNIQFGLYTFFVDNQLSAAHKLKCLTIFFFLRIGDVLGNV